jgi:hypothetical protein
MTKRSIDDILKAMNTCIKCYKIFDTYLDLRIHIFNNHIDSNNSVMIPENTCSICHKSFSSKAYVKIHTKAVHDKKYDHECTKCGKLFKYSSNKSTHMKRCNKINTNIYHSITKKIKSK